MGRNQKLSPKFSGPHIIISLKGTHNAEIMMQNKRKVIVNVERLKPYFSNASSYSNTDNCVPLPSPNFSTSQNVVPEKNENVVSEKNLSASPSLLNKQ